MLPLDTLQYPAFVELVGRTFQVTALDGAGAGVALILENAKLVGEKAAGLEREPFSLIFTGAPGLMISQGTYRFECDGFGVMEIFITQLSARPAGSEFEAIFS